MVEKDSVLASQIRYDLEQFETIEQALKEHEQHKAIEQELGIDLITLIKALKNGAWYIHITEEKKYYEYEKHPELKLNYDRWCICFDYEHCYPISSYLDKNDGWALTKEELEKC
jgi:hypothetical protein